MLQSDRRAQLLSDIAAAAIPDTVDLWPALNERLSATRRFQGRRLNRPFVGAIGAAAALVTLLALASLPFWNTTEAVSAETILDRAETAASDGAAAVSTYHLVMSRGSKEGGSTRSEIWFAGADRQRTIQQALGANGAVLSRQDVVFNGSETWLENTDNGVTRVVHTIGTTWTRPAESPSAQQSLADLMKSIGSKTCMSARLEQTQATVAGQDTYVVLARPSVVGCDPASSAAAVGPSPGPSGERMRVNGQPAGGQLTRANELTAWIDKRSFLPLKMEVRDAHGTLVDRSEVSRVEYNVALPDSTFAYTPPPGVSVRTFNGGDGADVKRALAGEMEQRVPRGKAP
jgi:outer membrane lipoprotein-sorting protein